jgi:hypothetical protein
MKTKFFLLLVLAISSVALANASEAIASPAAEITAVAAAPNMTATMQALTAAPYALLLNGFNSTTTPVRAAARPAKSRNYSPIGGQVAKFEDTKSCDSSFGCVFFNICSTDAPPCDLGCILAPWLCSAD